MAFELGSAYGKILIDISGVLKAVDQARGAFGQIEKFAQRVGPAMQRAGDQMTRGLTLPLAGIGLAAGKASMDFEKSMQQIVGLVGESQQQVDAWSQELLKLGPELGRGPKELAEALYFVTSSGIETGKAMSVVEASGKAAAAGLGETKVIADAVTSALNAYAGSNLEAGDATGILVAAVREGKGEASEMAQSIGRVIPVAAQLGVSFDQVAAAMAAQSLVGFDAAESATNLSGILSAFLKPSKQAAETLEEFGLSAEGVRRSLAEDGLLATLVMLRDTVGDDDEALAKIFPNVRAFRGLLSLVGENAETTAGIFSELAQATEEDLGSAFESAAKTSAFKFNQAMAEVQASLIDLGATVLPVLMPVLKQLVGIIKDVVDWFKSLPEPTQQTIVQILALTAALGPLLSIGGRLISGVGALAGVLGTLSGALVGGARAAGSLAKTGVEVVQYLHEAGALTPALALKMGVLGAGLVVIAKYLEQVGRAASASNDELLKMSKSGDVFEQAAASTEILVNGTRRVNDAFEEHQAHMRGLATSSGEARITLEKYNNEILRSSLVAGKSKDVTAFYTQEITESGIEAVAAAHGYQVYEGALVKVGKGVELLTQAQIEALDAGRELVEGPMDEGRRALGGFAMAAKQAGDGVGHLGDNIPPTAEELAALAEAAKRARDSLAGTRLRAIEYTQTNQEVADKLAELAELEEEIAKRGPAYAAQVSNKKMTAEERATAEAKLAQAIANLAEEEGKGSEVDVDRAAKIASLKEKIAELNDSLGTHAGVVGGATAEQLKHRDALLADIEAMQKASETAKATEAFEALTSAFQEGSLSQAEYLSRATALNLATRLYTPEALNAATAQETFIKALTDPATRDFLTLLGDYKTNLDGIVEPIGKAAEATKRLTKEDLMDMMGNADESQRKVKESVTTVQTETDKAKLAVGELDTQLSTMAAKDYTIHIPIVIGDMPPLPGGASGGGDGGRNGDTRRGRRLQHGGRMFPGLPTLINEMGLTRPEVVVAPRGGYVLTRQDAQEALRGAVGGLQPQRGGDTYHVTINDAAAMRLWQDERRRRKNERIEDNL